MSSLIQTFAVMPRSKLHLNLISVFMFHSQSPIRLGTLFEQREPATASAGSTSKDTAEAGTSQPVFNRPMSPADVEIDESVLAAEMEEGEGEESECVKKFYMAYG